MTIEKMKTVNWSFKKVIALIYTKCNENHCLCGLLKKIEFMCWLNEIGLEMFQLWILQI